MSKIKDNKKIDKVSSDKTTNKEGNKKSITEHKGLWQFIKFLLVGVSNTIVSYVVYSIVYHLIIANVHVANVVAFIISVLWAFMMQVKFVFREEDGHEKRVWWKVLLKTYAAYAFTGLFLTEIWFIVWLKGIKLQNYMGTIADILLKFGIEMSHYDIAASLVPIINIFINTPINFVVNKFWAYRQKKI